MLTFEQLDVILHVGTILLLVIFYFALGDWFMVVRTFRCEERVLGFSVCFHRDDKGWFWQVKRFPVTCDAALRFPSLGSARLGAMASLYAYAVIEEVTSTIVFPDGSTQPAKDFPADRDPPASPRQG